MRDRGLIWLIPAIIILAGCAGDDAEIRIGLQNCGGGVPCPDIHVSIADGMWHRECIMNDSNRSVGPVPTMTSGRLLVTLAVFADNVETETIGALALDLRQGWRWGVDIFIQENDPLDVCFGCFGSKEYELDPILGYDPGIKMYVVWGGNSIRNPVDY